MSHRLKYLSGIVSYSYLQVVNFMPSLAVWSGIDKTDNLVAKWECAEFRFIYHHQGLALRL